jgi:hypothetical protein
MRHRLHFARGVVFLLAAAISVATAELALRVAAPPPGKV